MTDVKLDGRANQYDFSGYWNNRISWWDCYQTVMQFDSVECPLSTQEGRNSFVIQAVVEQVGFTGEVFRYKVAISNDSHIWRELSDVWESC